MNSIFRKKANLTLMGVVILCSLLMSVIMAIPSYAADKDAVRKDFFRVNPEYSCFTEREIERMYKHDLYSRQEFFFTDSETSSPNCTYNSKTGIYSYFHDYVLDPRNKDIYIAMYSDAPAWDNESCTLWIRYQSEGDEPKFIRRNGSEVLLSEIKGAEKSRLNGSDYLIRLPLEVSTLASLCYFSDDLYNMRTLKLGKGKYSISYIGVDNPSRGYSAVRGITNDTDYLGPVAEAYWSVNEGETSFIKCSMDNNKVNIVTDEGRTVTDLSSSEDEGVTTISFEKPENNTDYVGRKKNIWGFYVN